MSEEIQPAEWTESEHAFLQHLESRPKNLKAAGSKKWPAIHFTWAIALGLFAIADVVALIATRH